MYSEQGFDALISPLFGHVCQELIVSWNCIPGSAQAHAAWPIFSHKSVALMVFETSPFVLLIKFQSWLFFTAFRKSLVTLTELFEFWPETVK